MKVAYPKAERAGEVQVAWELGRRMQHVETEGWKEGMEGQKDQRLEGREGVEEEGWMLPQSLHKAHAATPCNLLKEGICLGALAWAGCSKGCPHGALC